MDEEQRRSGRHGRVVLLDDPHRLIGGRTAVPLAELAPWAALGLAIATILLHVVSAEQGAVMIFDERLVHDYVRDGRVLLGFPC